MDSPFFVTYTGCDDLHLVCTRNPDGIARVSSTYNTHDGATTAAAKKNLDQGLRHCAVILDNNDLAQDTPLIELMETLEMLLQVVRYDLNGYLANRRIDDAKHLPTSNTELEATA